MCSVSALLYYIRISDTCFSAEHSRLTFSRVPEASEGMNESYLCLTEQILCNMCCIAPTDLAARKMDTTEDEKVPV